MAPSSGSEARRPSLVTEELLAQTAWLRRLARSLVADAATADDVVQDAWVATLSSPPAADRPLKPWIARVVQNLVRTRHRVDVRRTAREIARFEPGHEPGSDETAGLIEVQRLLIDAVEKLEEPLRSTVLRHYFQARTSVEIAREDHVAEGTVRWRLKQAIDELRKRLDARHAGDRRAWAVILVPLARRAHAGASPTTVAAGAAAGVFLMSTWTKVALAAVIIALSLGGWLATRRTESVTPPITAIGSSAPVKLAAPAAVDPTVSTPVREALPNSSTAASPTAPASPKPDYIAYVEARVLDARGAPIAGAIMTCIDNVRPDGLARDAAPQAMTGDDGRVKLALRKSDASKRRGRSANAPADTWGHELEFTAATKASQTVWIDVKADGTFSAGDIRLEAGGDLAGRAVDAGGVALDGARIALILDELTQKDRDGLIQRGLLDKPTKGSATTGDDGAFSIRAVPIGRYRVWSRMPGRINVVSEPFEVRAGETTSVPEIVLPENVRAIRGVVLDLDGLPARKSEVQFTKSEGEDDFWVGVDTDAKGRFAVEEFDTPTVDVYAIGAWMKADEEPSKEPRDRGQVLVRDVKAGTRDLVLRLAPTPITRVIIKDREGRPAGPVGVSLFDLRGNGGGGTFQTGEQLVRFLAKPCKLVVSGPGLKTQTLGPFEPGPRPTVLDVVVERVAMVSGRVTLDGHPLERFTGVGAYNLLAPGSAITCNGFDMRLDPNDSVGTGTDKDGHFAFNVDEPGTWVILASHAGCATWESEPLELGPTHGKEGLEIALGHGGSVEDRVTSISGAETEPAYVTLSRGTGSDASTHVNVDGTFHLDNLTPGAWKARLTRRDHSDERNIQSNMPADPAARDVAVVDGKTTRIELDARVFTIPLVAGRLSMQGVDARTWSAVIQSTGRDRPRDPAVAVDENGTFRLAADETGPHRLTLTRAPSPDRSDTIEQVLDLSHATTDWALDVATGGLRLPAAAAGDFVLTWTATSGAKWTAHVHKAAGADLAVDRVPTGDVRIAAPDKRSADVLVAAGSVTPVAWK